MFDSPSNRQPIATRSFPWKRRYWTLVAICLVAVLVLFLINRGGGGEQELPEDQRLTSKARQTDSANASSTPGSPQLDLESPATPAEPDYEAEEFTHVPVWMPRPGSAVTAQAIDATLRSDGSLKGTLRYEFGADQPEALALITTHLEAAGMRPDSSGSVFASADPPRRSEIQVKSSADGGTLVTLIYQGTDHEKACACPTCLTPP